MEQATGSSDMLNMTILIFNNDSAPATPDLVSNLVIIGPNKAIDYWIPAFARMTDR